MAEVAVWDIARGYGKAVGIGEYARERIVSLYHLQEEGVVAGHHIRVGHLAGSLGP